MSQTQQMTEEINLEAFWGVLRKLSPDDQKIIDARISMEAAQARKQGAEEETIRVEIELDKAYPKDGLVPKRDVLFLLANGKAESLQQGVGGGSSHPYLCAGCGSFHEKGAHCKQGKESNL